MMTQTEATIYLSEKRTPSQIGFKTEADGITVFDNILGPNQSFELEVQTSVLLIPYIGDLEVANFKLLEENQIQIFSESGKYSIQNPYPEDAINFFEIHIQNPSLKTNTNPILIELDKNQNQLISVIDGIKIGQFDGREEGVYKVQNADNKVFVYAIEGAFEAQNRLLHPRDGLVLQYIDEVEFEALSNNAIILFIEVSVVI